MVRWDVEGVAQRRMTGILAWFGGVERTRKRKVWSAEGLVRKAECGPMTFRPQVSFDMEAITIAIGELTGCITYTWVSRTVLRLPFCVKVCTPYRLEDVKVLKKRPISWLLHQFCDEYILYRGVPGRTE